MWQTVFPAALRTEGLVSALGRQKGSRHQGAQRTEPCGLQNVASFCRPLERQKWIPSPSLFDSSGCYLPVLLNRGEIQGWFLDVFGVAWNPLLKIETVSLNYVILLARLVCTCAWVHASTLIHTHIHTPSRSLSLSFAHMPPSSHSLLLSPPPKHEHLHSHTHIHTHAQIYINFRFLQNLLSVFTRVTSINNLKCKHWSIFFRISTQF